MIDAGALLAEARAAALASYSPYSRGRVLAGVDAGADGSAAALMPCGMCPQVMREFAGLELPVHVDRVRSYTLAELLPHPFALE